MHLLKDLIIIIVVVRIFIIIAHNDDNLYPKSLNKTNKNAPLRLHMCDTIQSVSQY